MLWLWLALRILRHLLHVLHLVVRLWEELPIRLVLLVAHVCHGIPIRIAIAPISILLMILLVLVLLVLVLLVLVCRLKGRHLREAIVGRPIGLRAPVVVHHDDIWCAGAWASCPAHSGREVPSVLGSAEEKSYDKAIIAFILSRWWCPAEGMAMS